MFFTEDGEAIVLAYWAVCASELYSWCCKILMHVVPKIEKFGPWLVNEGPAYFGPWANLEMLLKRTRMLYRSHVCQPITKTLASHKA